MKRIFLITCLLASPALSDPAQIVDVVASPMTTGWRFDVTLQHTDTGWEDYADGWRVEMRDGTILGTRPLAHPHVHEQPFTRSLTGVAVPEEASDIYVRTRTSQTGWAEDRFAVRLP